MRPVIRTSLRTLVVLILAALTAVGCRGGDTDTDTGSGDASGAGVAALVHVDGTITATDDGFTVTPDTGEPRTFTAGPEVERAAVMALDASGEPARVTYRDGGSLVAAAIAPAPELGEGVDSAEGMVVSIDGQQLVITGDDGERTFDISDADPTAFDVGHLQDHANEAEPIRVYFRTDAPDAGIAYEDA